MIFIKNHKILFVIIFVLFTKQISFSQSKIIKILVDSNNKNPLISATINNAKDYTITNEEGKFVFISKLDSIKIKMLGYKDINTTFSLLKQKSDTLFLEQKNYQLQEVTLLNGKELLFKVYKNIQKNYPHFSYGEIFFLRSVLKKNNKIIKLVDLYGKLNRTSLFSTQTIKDINYRVELLNLRKVGVLNKSKRVSDFKLLSINELINWFSSVFLNYNHYRFDVEQTKDPNYVKLNFTPLPDFSGKKIGYYIINLDDYSIKSYYSETNPNFPLDKITYTKGRGIKWRTIQANIRIHYEKNDSLNKYYINNVRINQKTESIVKDAKLSVFDTYYEFLTVKNFTNKKIKTNISIKKNIFKLEHKYSEEFWKKQNQLLLTKEMKQFLNNFDNTNNQFIIFSNM